MKKLLLIIGVILISLGTGVAQKRDNTFMKQIHLPGIDIPTGIAELDDGWIISALSSSKYPMYNISSTYFTKLDLKGNIIWEKFYGDTLLPYLIIMDHSIIQDNNSLRILKDGNILAIGKSGLNGYEPPLAIKINSLNGDTLWTFKDDFKDYFDAWDGTEDSEGNIYLLYMRKYFNKDGYPCIYKIDKNGKLLWKNHMIGFAETTPTRIFVKNDIPIFSVMFFDLKKYRDSVVFQKLDPKSGKLLGSKAIEPNAYSSGIPASDLLQIFFIDNQYNVLLSSSSKNRYKTQVFLDTGLNVISSNLLNCNDTDTYINQLYGKGYSYRISHKIIFYTNPFNNIELMARTCDSDIGDSTIYFMYESKHGGAIQLGWVFTEGIDQWRSCYDKIDCKDILFVKSDSLGRYFPDPKTTNGKIIYFPNPAGSKLTVQFELKYPSDVNISIYDALGRLVKDINHFYSKKDFNELNINITDLSSGIYILSVKSEEFEYTNKLIVQ